MIETISFVFWAFRIFSLKPLVIRKRDTLVKAFSIKPVAPSGASKRKAGRLIRGLGGVGVPPAQIFISRFLQLEVRLYTTLLSFSPVLILIACSTVLIKIFPSPRLPVKAFVLIIPEILSASSSSQ